MSAPTRTAPATPGTPVRGHAAEGDVVTIDPKHAHRPRTWRVARVPAFVGDKFLIMNSAGVCREATLTGSWRFAR